MKDSPPKVAIVILNYNTRSLLERFLGGVLATSYVNKEVWVVDNASTDDSVAVSYKLLRANETGRNLECRLWLEKKKKKIHEYNSTKTQVTTNAAHH